MVRGNKKKNKKETPSDSAGPSQSAPEIVPEEPKPPKGKTGPPPGQQEAPPGQQGAPPGQQGAPQGLQRPTTGQGQQGPRVLQPPPGFDQSAQPAGRGSGRGQVQTPIQPQARGREQGPPTQAWGQEQGTPSQAWGQEQGPPTQAWGQEQGPLTQAWGQAQGPPRARGPAQGPPRARGPGQGPPTRARGPGQGPPTQARGPAQWPPPQARGPAQGPPPRVWGQQAQGPPQKAQEPPTQTWGQPAQPPPAQGAWSMTGVAQALPPSGPPQAGRGPSQHTTEPPQAGRGPPQPSRSAQQRTPPQAAPQRAEAGADGDQRQSNVICKFSIPPVIPGNTVPVMAVVKVLCNYLPMKVNWGKIYRYDVSFAPLQPKKLIPLAFAAAKRALFPQHLTAFDQMKNLYCRTPLPKVSTHDRTAVTVEVLDNNKRAVKYEVSFKATGIVDMTTIPQYMENKGTSLNPPTEAIQCIDVILRQGTLQGNYIKAGRQFFRRPAQPIPLGDGLEMWTGLFQSAIFTSRAFINIDVAHKGFPIHQPLLTTVTNEFRLDTSRPLSEQRGRGVDSFLAFLKGLRVIAYVGGDRNGQRRVFIVNDIAEPPYKLRFQATDDSGKEVTKTVAEYFVKDKGISLRYPNFNCAWVGPRDKNIFYPMELLDVDYGQARNRQLNDMQLSTMVREAATPPHIRKRKIEEVIRDMNYSRNPEFRQFGLEIEEKFHEVTARVLQPPRLDCGMQQPVTPSRGEWRAPRLLQPEALQSWGLIGLETDARSSNGEDIIALLKSEGSRLGMRVAQPHAPWYNVRITQLQAVLMDALRKEIRFLVIVISTRGKDYYHKVKQFAERDVGILTQCIKEYTATKRMNGQTAKNILLKMNSKLMGINQALSRSSVPACLAAGDVMVVGADVTHPSPDQTSVPSIAAVTASMDAHCFKYNIQLSIQTPRKEMIVEFEDMMVEHLKVYIKARRSLPRKIYVFRDGVSEGQFAQVMNSELQAVHDAYRRMLPPGNTTKPEVLFLLVQKRHHTRLFAKGDRGEVSNVLPGTVVDTDIVHAKELDFYLVSHQAIKGTARPTRYHAVCNDGRLASDAVEQLTYYLCHLFSRCMRAVSYPTPTYYAHLACLRARSLTYGQKFDNAQLERQPIRLNVMDKMLEFSRMFFV